MFSPKEENPAVLPGPKPSDPSVLAGGASLPDPSQGLCGGQACGQPGAEQTQPPPGKAEGKGEAHLASLVPLGAKAIPKPRGKRAADPPCSC